MEAILDAVWEKGYPSYALSYSNSTGKKIYYLSMAYEKPSDFVGTHVDLQKYAEAEYRKKLQNVQNIMTSSETLKVILNYDAGGELCTFEITK